MSKKTGYTRCGKSTVQMAGYVPAVCVFRKFKLKLSYDKQ